MIAIVNYGLGNVHAFLDVFSRLNVPAGIATTAGEIESATKIVLPGVGAFDLAMSLLDRSGMREALDRRVMEEGVPVLGVCVGMQMMARGSEEGTSAGLSWIPADVHRFGSGGGSADLRLPHMGWNDAEPTAKGRDSLFAGIDEPRFYFLHSYYFLPDDADVILSTTPYHGHFASAVASRNIFGTQFHPEKSHRWGMRLLGNFAGL